MPDVRAILWVRIDVTVPPGHELVANEGNRPHEMHEPLKKVINDALKTMDVC